MGIFIEAKGELYNINTIRKIKKSDGQYTLTTSERRNGEYVIITIDDKQYEELRKKLEIIDAGRGSRY